MGPSAAVTLDHIEKSFGHIRALSGASIEILPGQVTAIVGDNGSGKSTLVKILSGNLRPDRGTITVDGTEYPHLTIRKSLSLGIRTVYQDLSLDDNKNCAENIFLGAELTCGPFLRKRAMLDEAQALLDSIHVKIEDLTAPAGRLSGGQRQGLAIARALRSESRLVVLDEPTAAMGIQETHSALELLRRLREHDVTELIVSHSLYQVFDLSDRIFVMRSGRCIADVRTADTSPEEIQRVILDRESEPGCV